MAVVGAGGGAVPVDSADSAGGAVVDPWGLVGLMWMAASAFAGAGACQATSPPNCQVEL